jgi:hypothetical protein
MFLCSWRRGKSHFLPSAQHLKPAIVVRLPGLIGFGQRVNQFGVEVDGRPSLRYITLLRKGARAHRLPETYIRFLDGVEHAV